MSLKLLSHQWTGRLDPLTHGEWAVWIALANHADAKGFCVMGLGRIATETHMARSSVQRHLALLLAQGFLRRAQSSATQKGTVYEVRAPLKPNPRPIVVVAVASDEDDLDSGHTDSRYTDDGYTDDGYTDQRSIGIPTVGTKPFEPCARPHARGRVDAAQGNGSAPSLGCEGALPSNGTRPRLDPRKHYAAPDRDDPLWVVKAPKFFDHEITFRTLIMLDAGESLEAIEAARAELVSEALNGVERIGQPPVPGYVAPPWPEEAAVNASV